MRKGRDGLADGVNLGDVCGGNGMLSWLVLGGRKFMMVGFQASDKYLVWELDLDSDMVMEWVCES